jgi:hypothetical protein
LSENGGMRVVLGLLGCSVLVTLVVLNPNLLWLVRLTATVTNASRNELRDLRVEVGDADVHIGVAVPGQSRFVFLPQAGDAMLGVTYVVDGELHRGCQEYVEGSMYHVDIVISEDLMASCSVSLPLLNRLLWSEAL